MNGVLAGDVKIQGDVKGFLDMAEDVNINKNDKWLSMVHEHPNRFNIKTNYSDIPIKPQTAI